MGGWLKMEGRGRARASHFLCALECLALHLALSAVAVTMSRVEVLVIMVHSLKEKDTSELE